MSNCYQDNCQINWDTEFQNYSDMWKQSTKVVTTTPMDVLSEDDMIDYADRSGITGGDSTNCWLNCMATSKCVGYKWNSVSKMCSLYENMGIGSTDKDVNDTISWVCNNNMNSGQLCSADNLLVGVNDYVTGGDKGGFTFQPDPNCTVFNCSGEAVPNPSPISSQTNNNIPISSPISSQTNNNIPFSKPYTKSQTPVYQPIDSCGTSMNCSFAQCNQGSLIDPYNY